MNKIRVLLIMCCILMFAQISFAKERIGVVDIQSLVNRSSAVKALKNEHSSQIQSLNSIVTEAQNAIARETDPQKIVILQDRYNEEFNRKKDIIDKQYQSKLTSIENSLRKDIEASAKKNNYDFVIAKSLVFYGGEDITEIIAKDIK